MIAFAERLFQAIREIDQDWDITEGEQKLCKRIASQFNSPVHGTWVRHCDDNKRYPDQISGAERYDLQIRFHSGETVVLEAKCHWPSYWLKRTGNLGTYQKHLFSTTTKAYSSKKDVAKLKRLAPLSATHLGLLLIGSYSVPPDPHSYLRISEDFDRFENETGVGSLPWSRDRIEDWPNPHAPYTTYRREVRLYLVERSQVAPEARN